MKTQLSYAEFQIVIAALDPRRAECMAEVIILRAMLEDAFSEHSLSLHQWRVLWEDVSLVQARCALLKPDAWRYPIVPDSKDTYVPQAKTE
jgi:hypothetical protein